MGYPLMNIPKEFYSTETNTPLERCIDCDRYLLEDGVEYIIEKAMRHYKRYDLNNTIFEYAICRECANKMMASLSRDSLSKINDHFEDHADLPLRALRNSKREDRPDLEELIGSCLLKGTAQKENQEYQICCQCVGDQMVLSHMPYMIGMEAMEEIQELLSPETKRELDGFVGDNFGLPPEWKKAIEDRPVLVV